MSYNYDVFDTSGKKIDSREFSSSLFEDGSLNESLLHEYVVMYLANQRQSTAHTKTRSEITGSGRKLYRQKGTGNARVGNAASPIRRKGGVVFGPRNERNYSKSMNKKMKKIALATAVGLKFKFGVVLGLDSFGLNSIKTKDVSSVISNLGISGNSLLVVGKSDDEVMYKSTRNIHKVSYVSAHNLNPYDLVAHKYLLILDGSLDVLVKRTEIA